MNLRLTVTALLVLLTFASTASGQKKCSCKATDNTCNAEVNCRHGGAAICGSKSVCYAACQGVDPDNSHTRISLKIKNKNSEKVTAELRRLSQRNIVFESRRKTDRLTFEINNHPLWHVLDLLSKRGKVLLDGTPFDRMKELRRKLSSDEKVSVSFTDIPVRNAVAKLSFLSGLPFRVESGDAEKLLSISLDEVTLSEIIAGISAQTGVKIERAQMSASDM